MIFSSLDSVHDCFGCFPLLLCFHGVCFCVYLVGGVVGRGHLMIVYSSGPKLLAFLLSAFLTKWEVHCCCFEAQHQTPRPDKPWATPNKSSWGSAGVSTCTPMGLNPEPLLVPGGPKMYYTDEPSPLRKPINITFGS